MSSLHWLDYSVMIVYLLLLAGIGLFCSQKKNTSREFLLGGGKLPFFALGISCLMAALSAFSLVMVPGEIFNHGLSFWVLSLIAPLLTLVTCRIFMRFYFQLGAFTPFAYLEARYDHRVRSLIAGLTIYLRLIYLGMVLFSTSKIFEGAAGWPAWFSILLIGSISLVFTTTGGLKAVVWTDVMQFVVLVGGLFCILGFLFSKIDGGPVGAVTYAFRHGRGLQQFSNPEFYSLNPYVRLSFWLLLLGQFMAPISTMASDQMTVQRLLASGSYANAVKTQTVNTFLTIPTMLVLWLIGLSIFTFYDQHPELSTSSGDTALFTFISTQLPPPVPGLVIAGMMAAVISTLNAVFNSMAAVYLKEFHQRYFNPGISEQAQVRISRLATAAIGAIAIALGMLIALSSGWLRQSVVEASTIFNAFDLIIIPSFIFAVFSRRASTTLVWVTAGLIWGLKLAMITWYSLSTSAAKDWISGSDPGFAGPQSWLPGLLLSISGILLILWFRRRKLAGMVIGMCFTGYGTGLLLWTLLSTLLAGNSAKALSFQWVSFPSIIAYVLLGVAWLKFGPPQAPEKYQGLTLFDPAPATLPDSKQKSS